MQITMTSRRNGKPRPKLESTTPAVRNAGVMVELEPIGVSGSGREQSQSCTCLTVNYQHIYRLEGPNYSI